jgi:cobalt-zinc-cadmium efflux system outer membrane protein
MPSQRAGRPFKRPMRGRCLLLLLGLTARAQGEQPQPGAEALTEAQALARALARPAVADLLGGEIDLARADAVEAGLWPSPTLTYSREQNSGGAPATTEDYATLTQTFDTSGRRYLHAQAATHRARGAEHRAASRRLEIEAEIRRRFFEVLLAQERQAALDQAAQRMERVSGIVRARESAGDVSGYDRRRVERERASLVARRETETARLDRARALLAALLGEEHPAPGWPRVTGSLLPTDEPPPLATLLERLPLRPELRALDEELAGAHEDIRAARRGAVPDLTLGGGYKGVAGLGGRADGFVATASLPLPLWNRHQDEQLRSSARRRVADAERYLALTGLGGEIRGLHAQAQRLALTAQTFRAETLAESPRLLAIAETGYQGGEAGILELLDAYRAALEAALEALELESNARQARIALDRAVGGTP